MYISGNHGDGVAIPQSFTVGSIAKSLPMGVPQKMLGKVVDIDLDAVSFPFFSYSPSLSCSL